MTNNRRTVIILRFSPNYHVLELLHFKQNVVPNVDKLESEEKLLLVCLSNFEFWAKRLWFGGETAWSWARNGSKIKDLRRKRQDTKLRSSLRLFVCNLLNYWLCFVIIFSPYVYTDDYCRQVILLKVCHRFFNLKFRILMYMYYFEIISKVYSKRRTVTTIIYSLSDKHVHTKDFRFHSYKIFSFL